MNESKPDVGSSQNIIEGFVKTSEAKDSLFISPPEMPFILPGMPILVFSHLINPSCNQNNFILDKARRKT